MECNVFADCRFLTVAAREHAPVTIDGDLEPAPEHKAKPKKTMSEFERLSLPPWLDSWDRHAVHTGYMGSCML